MALISAAGILSLYVGAAPFTTRTETATVSGPTTTFTSVTTLPAQVVQVTQTGTVTTTAVTTATITTATTVVSTSVITTSATASSSEISLLEKELNLTQKTVIANDKTYTVGPGRNCGVNCIAGNYSTILTFNASTAGFVLISGTQVSGYPGAMYMYVDYSFTSLADNVGCNLNVSCTYNYFYPQTSAYPQSSYPALFPVLPGTVTIVANNDWNTTASASLTIDYFT